MNNKHYKHWEIFVSKFRQLIRLFAIDLTASDAAKFAGMSRRSVTNIYGRLLRNITEWSVREAPLEGAIEVDQSYFDPRQTRPRGRRLNDRQRHLQASGQGVYRNCPKRAKSHTSACYLWESGSRRALFTATAGAATGGLVDVGYGKHYRVQHGQEEFATLPSHTGGIESFWSFANRRFSQFNGIPKPTFYLH